MEALGTWNIPLFISTFNNFCRYLFTFSDLLFKLCLTLKVESMTKVNLTFKMGDSHLNLWKVLKIGFIIGLLVRLPFPLNYILH